MAQCRSENMTVGPVTLAFPHLFQPQKPRDSNNEPKYNAVAILTRAQYDQLLPLMMFSASAFRNGESNRADFKWGMKPCSNEPERYPVAAQRGMYFMTVSCSQEFKPRVVDANRQDIIDPGVVRDGTQAYISVNFYDYNKAGNIGVAAGLGPVMIVGDGEVLNTGGGVSVDAAASDAAATGATASCTAAAASHAAATGATASCTAAASHAAATGATAAASWVSARLRATPAVITHGQGWPQPGE